MFVCDHRFGNLQPLLFQVTCVPLYLTRSSFLSFPTEILTMHNWSAQSCPLNLLHFLCFSSFFFCSWLDSFKWRYWEFISSLFCLAKSVVESLEWIFQFSYPVFQNGFFCSFFFFVIISILFMYDLPECVDIYAYFFSFNSLCTFMMFC